MEDILKPLAIYAFLVIVVRISGRRTLANMTAFDFVLLLIVGESTQQALAGPDYSAMNAFVTVAALIGADIAMSELKQRSPRVERIVDGLPIVLIEDGRRHQDRMNKARVDDQDILEAARQHHGLSRLAQVRYAVLERTGGISVIPYPDPPPTSPPLASGPEAAT